MASKETDRLSAKQLFERYRVVFSRIFLLILGLGLLFVGSKWERTPLIGTILFMAACVLAGIASLGRLWCALYISGYKDNTLVMVGPYSLCRNPLYFFSLLGAIGVALATKTITIPLIALVLFLIYYPLVIKSEELRLSAIHKERFESYRQAIPAFFPRRAKFQEPDEYTVRPMIFRKNLFDAIWFVWLIGILELISTLHETKIVPVLFSIY
ncbi:MAG: isoprenylcysteine carboxylmethyltransferase family protein [Desulfatitalea sp.]